MTDSTCAHVLALGALMASVLVGCGANGQQPQTQATDRGTPAVTMDGAADGAAVTQDSSPDDEPEPARTGPPEELLAEDLRAYMDAYAKAFAEADSLVLLDHLANPELREELQENVLDPIREAGGVEPFEFRTHVEVQELAPSRQKSHATICFVPTEDVNIVDEDGDVVDTLYNSDEPTAFQIVATRMSDDEPFKVTSQSVIRDEAERQDACEGLDAPS